MFIAQNQIKKCGQYEGDEQHEDISKADIRKINELWLKTNWQAEGKRKCNHLNTKSIFSKWFLENHGFGEDNINSRFNRILQEVWMVFGFLFLLNDL
jgi:hypothetical protein